VGVAALKWRSLDLTANLIGSRVRLFLSFFFSFYLPFFLSFFVAFDTAYCIAVFASIWNPNSFEK
jgi:hypothetical protein